MTTPAGGALDKPSKEVPQDFEIRGAADRAAENRPGVLPHPHVFVNVENESLNQIWRRCRLCALVYGPDLRHLPEYLAHRAQEDTARAQNSVRIYDSAKNRR